MEQAGLVNGRLASDLLLDLVLGAITPECIEYASNVSARNDRPPDSSMYFMTLVSAIVYLTASRTMGRRAGNEKLDGLCPLVGHYLPDLRKDQIAMIVNAKLESDNTICDIELRYEGQVQNEHTLGVTMSLGQRLEIIFAERPGFDAEISEISIDLAANEKPFY